jgi:hypothetical protein
METGFLVLVIPGRDPGIAPTDGVRLDPRITSGDHEETTDVGRKLLRRRRYPDAWWGLSRPSARYRRCADGRTDPGDDGEDTVHSI